MNVLVSGDWHGDLEAVEICARIAQFRECEVIIQLGDFGLGWNPKFPQQVSEKLAKRDLHVVWLDGNHENFELLAELVASTTPTSKGFHKIAECVYYSPRGNVFQLGTKTCMTLGGGFSVDKAYRQEGVSWWPQETLTIPQVHSACEKGKVDVLFSHDGLPATRPEHFSHDWPEDADNQRAVQQVFEAIQPSEMYHGHWHMMYRKVVNGCRIRGLGCDPTSDMTTVMEA